MASKSKSRYMKTGNIADNRVGLAPNPEEKPTAVKKPLKKKANSKVTKPVSPKKPSPNAPAPNNKPAPNASKKAKTPAKSAPAKSAPAKSAPAKFAAKKNANANTAKTNKNAPKYRFNSPSNSVLTAHNFEDLYRLEGKGESREEFKRKM